MQSMSVQPQQVIALSNQIRVGANGIKSQLDDLDSAVSKLRAAWDGQAQVAYDDAQRKWTQSITELNTLLGQIASKTEEISHGYVSGDKSSAGRFAV